MNVVRPYANRFSLILLSCVILVAISACENPGSVGGSFTDIGSEVVVDTLEIGEIDTDSVIAYSGMLAYFSAGQFDDPLFGSMTATGLIRPSLPSSSSSNEIEDDAEVRLKLMINKNGLYGDSLEVAEYDLVEIDQIWRGKAWRLNNQVQVLNNGPVASFEIDQEDSLEVPLDSSWVDKYREFYESDASNRDSLYTYNFHGLALVPRNESRIIPFDPSGSEFIVMNPEADTFNIGMTQWAYSLQRSDEQPAPTGSETVHSTLEKVIAFDMDLGEENLGTVNIARVDLVLYRDNEVLNETIQQVSPSAARPQSLTAQLHLIDPEHISSALDPGNPIVIGQYDEDDEAYHFNITSYVNGVLLDDMETDKRFYVRLQQNDGVVRSSLLYNHEAPPGKQPKLIVTSTKSEGSSN